VENNRAVVGAILFSGVAFWGTRANATLTITPPSPYSITSSGVVDMPRRGGSATSPTGGYVDTEAGFKFINLLRKLGNR
jgi:hypothetical protein